MAWDPVLRLLAIGTATGSVKVYPFSSGHLLNCPSDKVFAAS